MRSVTAGAFQFGPGAACSRAPEIAVAQAPSGRLWMNPLIGSGPRWAMGGSRWETVFLPGRHHSGKVAQVELDRGGEDVAGVQSRLHVPLGDPVALHLHTGPA